MSDPTLIERLERCAALLPDWANDPECAMKEAAARIRELEAENVRLQRAIDNLIDRPTDEASRLRAHIRKLERLLGGKDTADIALAEFVRRHPNLAGGNEDAR